MARFERITGKKTDRWLVQMVGLLAAGIGVSLMLAARDEEVGAPSLALSAMAAIAFAGIDVVHTARRRISPIYLADAGVEAALVISLVRRLL